MIKIYVFIIIASNCNYVEGKDPDNFPIKSFRNLDISEFNNKVTQAEKNKEEWISTPLSISLKLHQVSTQRFVSIRQKSDRAECPLNSVVTIVEESFLDDQLRGKWIQFHFERKDCLQLWRIKEVREAYLCGIKGSEETFKRDSCR